MAETENSHNLCTEKVSEEVEIKNDHIIDEIVDVIDELNGNDSGSCNNFKDIAQEPIKVEIEHENEVINEDVIAQSKEIVIAQDKNDSDKFKNDIFNVKLISFEEKNQLICLQSENGPCPIIAIINILILQDKINVDREMEYLTGDQIVNLVGEYIMTRMDEACGDVDPILRNFNELHTGLIVDVCFNNVTAFSDSPNLDIFKFLDINLYHGWIMDPQMTNDYDQLISYSYDQIMCELVKETENIFSNDTKQFLNDFLKNQMTISGICQLNETMKERELAVLFYNNHFSVIYKKDSVYLLSTDIGYNLEPGTVWQLLNSTSGDTDLVNEKFELQSSYNNLSAEANDLEFAKTIAMNDDFEIAKQLQDEENEREISDTRSYTGHNRPTPAPRPTTSTTPPVDRNPFGCTML